MNSRIWEHDLPEGELRFKPLAILKKPSSTIDIAPQMARPTAKPTDSFKRKQGQPAKGHAIRQVRWQGKGGKEESVSVRF